MKNELIGLAVEELRHLRSRLVEQPIGTAAEELDGLSLQLSLPTGVLRKDGLRRRAERAMVEENYVRVEQELLTQYVRRWRC